MADDTSKKCEELLTRLLEESQLVTRRPYSIKTRIKTQCGLPCLQVHGLADHIPLKQGFEIGAGRPTCPTCPTCPTYPRRARCHLIPTLAFFNLRKK